jgi:hypothetical protein
MAVTTRPRCSMTAAADAESGQRSADSQRRMQLTAFAEWHTSSSSLAGRFIWSWEERQILAGHRRRRRRRLTRSPLKLSRAIDHGRQSIIHAKAFHHRQKIILLCHKVACKACHVCEVQRLLSLKRLKEYGRHKRYSSDSMQT